MDDILNKKLQKWQCIRLLGYMQKEPMREWIASDFQDAPYFIGYEAGPRLCDLCDRWLAIRVGKRERFTVFSISEAGRNFDLSSPLPKIEKKKKDKEIHAPEKSPHESMIERWFIKLHEAMPTWYKRHDVLVCFTPMMIVVGTREHHFHYQRFMRPRELIDFLDLLLKYRVW